MKFISLLGAQHATHTVDESRGLPPEIRGYGRPCQRSLINKITPSQTQQKSANYQAKIKVEALKMKIVIVSSLLAFTLLCMSQCFVQGAFMPEHPQTSFCRADFGELLFLYNIRSL